MGPFLEHVGACALAGASRGLLVLLLALAAAALLRRAAAATRHTLWTAALALAALLPLGTTLLPPLRIPLLPAPAAAPGWAGPLILPGDVASPVPAPPLPPAPAATSASPAPPSSPARTIPGALWLVGVGVAARRFFRGRRQAARWLAQTRPADPALWPAPAGVRVRAGDAIDLPMTVGSLRPVVLVPANADWPAEWRRAALAHEVAHVRRRDPLAQLIAEVACALHWWNPLCWLAAHQLRTERELAADDEVLAEGTRPSAYTAMLLGLACQPATLPAVGAVVPLLTPAGLRARLRGVLDGRRARGGGWGSRTALAAAAVLLFLPAAAAIPVARAPRTTAEAILPGTGRPIARAFDAATGRALGGAEVAVHGWRFGARSLRADSDGWIRWPAGLPATDDFVLYVRQGALAARKRVLAVPYGTSLPTDIQLRPALSVSGHVRDEHGAPVAGATVRVVGSDRTAVGPGPDMMATADAQGLYVFPGLLYGAFDLIYESPAGVAAGRHLTVDQTDLVNIDVVVPSRWRVSGWVKDEAGRPVAGAHVEATSGGLPPGVPLVERRHWTWDETAADGSFRIASFRRALRALAPDGRGGWLMAETERGQGKITVPLTLTVRPTLYIAGTVRGGGGWPAGGLRVFALQALDPSRFTVMWRMSVAPDPQGRFVLGPLSPGTYDLTVMSGDVLVRSTHQKIVLGDRPVEDVGLVVASDQPVEKAVLFFQKP